ncbi:SPOR domain-containing protein, partial [Bacteroidota bacterium]
TRAEAVRKHREKSRKSSASKFLTIAAIFIIVAVVFYLFTKSNGTTELAEETLPEIERTHNVTYIERSYDIPVTYPYLKQDTEMKVVGLNLIEIKDVEPEKIIEDDNPPKEIVENKPPIKKEVTEEKPTVNVPDNDAPKEVVKNKPPVKKEETEEKPIVDLPVNDAPKEVVEKKPPTKKEVTEEKPTVSFPVKKPSGTPVQAAFSIYKYEDIYIVQVASLRKKNAAESEAAKYITKGYNVFLEEAILDGVTWHRVRVGNFDTLEKAKQFRKSNN